MSGKAGKEEYLPHPWRNNWNPRIKRSWNQWSEGVDRLNNYYCLFSQTMVCNYGISCVVQLPRARSSRILRQKRSFYWLLVMVT